MPSSVASIMPGGTVFIPLIGTVPLLESGLAWNRAGISPALALALAVAEKGLLRRR